MARPASAPPTGQSLAGLVALIVSLLAVFTSQVLGAR